MSISDRIYLILADGTANYEKLSALTDQPSSSLIPTTEPVIECQESITLKQSINTVNPELAVYLDKPSSTISIFA